MPGMKVTVDSAMRARDVSRPRPEDAARAAAADEGPRLAGQGTAARRAADRDTVIPGNPASRANPAGPARTASEANSVSPADLAKPARAASEGDSVSPAKFIAPERSAPAATPAGSADPGDAPGPARQAPAGPTPVSLSGPGARRRARRRPRR
jgi:peptide/nickel transport system ATP-binding protein